MAIATVKLVDDLSAPAQKVASSTGRMRDEFGRFVTSGKSLTQQMTSLTGTTQGIDKSLTKVARQVQNLDFGGLPKFFAQGLLQGKSFTGMLDGLAGAIDPITLGLNMIELHLELLAGAALAGAAALVGMMAAAIEVNEKARTMTNRLQALTGDAKGTTDMINELRDSMKGAFTAGELTQFAIKLSAAGYKGAELRSAIEAVAAATALMGEQGGQAAQTMLQKIKELSDTGGKLKLSARVLNQLAQMGVTAEDLAAELHKPVDQLHNVSLASDEASKALTNILKRKGADAMKDKALEVGTIMNRLSANLSGLFKGLDSAVKPFMQALANLVGLTDKGSGASSMLSGIIKAILVPAFKYATMGVKALHVALSYVINWALKAAIAFNAFRKTAAGAAIINTVKNALLALAVAVGVFVVAVVAVVGALAAWIGFLFLLPEIIAGAIAVVGTVVVGALSWILDSIGGFVGSALSTLKGWAASAYSAGSDFVASIAAGIMGGAGALMGAVTGLASSAVGALKNALNMHSPSPLLIGIGHQVGSDVSTGMQQSSGQVAAAASQTGGAAVGGVAAGASGGGKGGGRTVTVTLQSGAIQIQGGSAASVLELTEAAVALIFERIALERGLAT